MSHLVVTACYGGMVNRKGTILLRESYFYLSFMYIGLQDYVLMGWIKLYFAILKEDSKLLLTGDISRPKYHSIPCLQTEISTHN